MTVPKRTGPFLTFTPNGIETAATSTFRASSDLTRKRQMPAWIAATHLFNHATHHRGQLTTLLKQAGIDPGVTDMPALPGVVRILD